MTDRIRAHPLIAFTAAVIALFAFYHFIPPGLKHYVDTVLVFTLAVAFAWAVVLMVRRTSIWTVRGLGLLGTVSGDALLYLAIGLGAAFGYRLELLDLARACLTLGAVLLLIGLTRTTIPQAPETKDQRDKRQDRREGRQDRREMRQDKQARHLNVRDEERATDT